MNSTVRILSVAAAAAFTALGAQASELYGADFEARVQSTRSRAEVQAEAAQAVTQFKNSLTVESNQKPNNKDQDNIQAHAEHNTHPHQTTISKRH